MVNKGNKAHTYRAKTAASVCDAGTPAQRLRAWPIEGIILVREDVVREPGMVACATRLFWVSRGLREQW